MGAGMIITTFTSVGTIGSVGYFCCWYMFLCCRFGRLGYYSAPYESRAPLGCSSEPVDELSLFSTVLLVVVLAVAGAFFIMAIACFIGEDHNTGEHHFSSQFPPQR